MFVAIHLTLNALNLIKWEDEKGNTHNFHLVTRARKKWKRIGMLLKYSLTELEDIKREQKGSDELCWISLMEKWLLDGGSSSYPATWEGLCHLLVDSESPNIAKLLRRVVTQATHQPSHQETTTITTEGQGSLIKVLLYYCNPLLQH